MQLLVIRGIVPVVLPLATLKADLGGEGDWGDRLGYVPVFVPV